MFGGVHVCVYGVGVLRVVCVWFVCGVCVVWVCVVPELRLLSNRLSVYVCVCVCLFAYVPVCMFVCACV